MDWPRVVEVRFTDMSILPGARAGQCGDDYVTVSDILSHLFLVIVYLKNFSKNNKFRTHAKFTNH